MHALITRCVNKQLKLSSTRIVKTKIIILVAIRITVAYTNNAAAATAAHS